MIVASGCRRRAAPRSRALACALLMLGGLAAGTAFAAEVEARAPDTPAIPNLAARVEAELARHRPALRENLGHYALVFPVEQAHLLSFLAQVRFFGAEPDLVLGTAHGLEPHGAGLLALIFNHWRPDGRAPTLADRFWFPDDRTSVELGALYRSNRHEIFLPVPGREPATIEGALPDVPQLPRMRFRVPGSDTVEVDAWHLLSLLTRLEPDLSATWTNHLGQPLSAELLLEQTQGYYLASRDTPGEPDDHSNLHLVEVLLEASRRRATEPTPIQRHFLDVELRRRVFDPADATLVIAHYAESLGLLLADERLRWSPAQRRQVLDWLAWLEAEPFRDLAGVDPPRLTHLLRGLRHIEAHRERLDQ